MSVLDSRTPVADGPTTQAASEQLRELGLEMQSQQQSEWCWAAVSTSVALFYDAAAPWTQCSVANTGLGQTTCCKDGGSSACNQPYYLSNGLEIVGHSGPNFGQRPALDAIAEQIDAGRPIGLCIDWTAGGGHFVVVDGYDLETGQIDVKDPLFGPSVVEDASFPASYQGGGTWSWTYLTRK